MILNRLPKVRDRFLARGSLHDWKYLPNQQEFGEIREFPVRCNGVEFRAKYGFLPGGRVCVRPA